MRKLNKILFTIAVVLLLCMKPGIRVEAENRWGISLTEEEKSLLAKIVYHEAGNQTANDNKGKKAVIAVVLNRMVDGRFGGTILSDVLFAKGQFTTEYELNRVKQGDWEAQLPVVNEVLDGCQDTDGMWYLYFSVGRGTSGNADKIQGQWFY